jgi:hypothetical protein
MKMKNMWMKKVMMKNKMKTKKSEHQVRLHADA